MTQFNKAKRELLPVSLRQKARLRLQGLNNKDIDAIPNSHQAMLIIMKLAREAANKARHEEKIAKPKGYDEDI